MPRRRYTPLKMMILGKKSRVGGWVKKSQATSLVTYVWGPHLRLPTPHTGQSQDRNFKPLDSKARESRREMEGTTKRKEENLQGEERWKEQQREKKKTSRERKIKNRKVG